MNKILNSFILKNWYGFCKVIFPTWTSCKTVFRSLLNNQPFPACSRCKPNTSTFPLTRRNLDFFGIRMVTKICEILRGPKVSNSVLKNRLQIGDFWSWDFWPWDFWSWDFKKTIFCPWLVLANFKMGVLKSRKIFKSGLKYHKDPW